MHFFSIPTSSRHEKHCRMSKRIYCLFQCSINYLCMARNFNIGTLLYCISMIFLMVAIQIRRYKTMAVAHSPIHFIGVKRPRDLESMLLNFNLLILIVINEGCMNLWQRYELFFMKLLRSAVSWGLFWDLSPFYLPCKQYFFLQAANISSCWL